MYLMTKFSPNFLFNIKIPTKSARSEVKPSLRATFGFNNNKRAIAIALHTPLTKQSAAFLTVITEARLGNSDFALATHGLTTVSHFDFAGDGS